MNNIPTKTAEDRAQLEKELAAAGRSLADFTKALISTSSYAILMGIDQLERQVQRIDAQLRNHKYCNRKGFKLQLNDVVAAMTRLRDLNNYLNRHNDQERLRIVCREGNEYQTENVQKMHWACINYLSYHKFDEPKTMAPVMVGIAVANMVEELIDERIAEVVPLCKNYQFVERLKPTDVSKTLIALAGAIEGCFNEVNCNFNDCEPLHTGIRVMKSNLFDLDTLELHVAYGIEQSEGKETLRREAPESFKKLHPKEAI